MNTWIQINGALLCRVWLCVGSLAPPTVQICSFRMNWGLYTDLRCAWLSVSVSLTWDEPETCYIWLGIGSSPHRVPEKDDECLNFHLSLNSLTAVTLVFNHKKYPVLAVSAWLAPFEHPVVEKINQRIEDITGLDVSTAEDLQVNLTKICIYLVPTPQLTITICVCLWLGGELWRWRTVRTSLWLWAGNRHFHFLGLVKMT